MGKVKRRLRPRETLEPTIDNVFGTTAHGVPVDNAALRYEFNLMTRSLHAGEDPFGGRGAGPKGWAFWFSDKFGITEDAALALAMRLQATMHG